MKNIYKYIFSTITALVLTGSINAQTQLVTDGGFEAGAGSGNWIETSTNFGTPLCNLGSCGNGSGTGPYSGTTWAWFGGVAGGVETASVSQSFVIPVGGTVSLKFWLEQILCDGPQDFIQVTIDGNVIFSSDGNSNLCGVLGYSLQSVNLSAYADGNIHTLEFNSTTFSFNGGYSNFFVDDVSVIHSVGGGGNNLCADTTTFSGINLAIPDGDINGVTNSQPISGLIGNLGVNIQLKSVCFKIEHSWIGDLIVKLKSPIGQEIILTDRPGFPTTVNGCSGDDLDVCVDLGTGNEMEFLCANLPAITGSFTAAGNADLNTINNSGISPNGNWQLFVSDSESDDIGTILEWSLVFDDGPVASWTSPGTVCAGAGSVSLDPLVSGTPGGTWSGTGVIGNSFAPAGLNGSFPVTYTVTNGAGGCIDAQTNIITVDSVAPASVFNFTTISLTAIFNNTSTGAATYLWNFGDGDTSTLENPNHSYNLSGTYIVTLSATNACGTTISTQTVIVQVCPDILVDGSFEAGQGSGNWVETSTNFGTPLCDPSCDQNGISQARTGDYWASFGGIVTFEEGSLSQNVTIATNNGATLTFWLQIPVCDSPDDFLKIAVDGDTLYSVNGGSNRCGTTVYGLQSINLDGYADGLIHTITFISKVYGNNGGITSFFVDDVTLNVCPGIGFGEIDFDHHISIMPIPASDFIQIHFNDLNATNVKIEVADMLGRTMLNSTISQVDHNMSQSINISGWSKGIYMLKITSGNNSTNRKIIVQ